MTSAQSQMTGDEDGVSRRHLSAILDGVTRGRQLGIPVEVGRGGWVEVTVFPLARLLVEMKRSWLWGVGSIFCVYLVFFVFSLVFFVFYLTD